MASSARNAQLSGPAPHAGSLDATGLRPCGMREPLPLCGSGLRCGASASFFLSFFCKHKRRVDDGQEWFSVAKSNVDLATGSNVVWNKTKHFFEDAKSMEVCFMKIR